MSNSSFNAWKHQMMDTEPLSYSHPSRKFFSYKCISVSLFWKEMLFQSSDMPSTSPLLKYTFHPEATRLGFAHSIPCANPEVSLTQSNLNTNNSNNKKLLNWNSKLPGSSSKWTGTSINTMNKKDASQANNVKELL